MYRFTFKPDDAENQKTERSLTDKMIALRTELFRAVDKSTKLVKGHAQLHLSGEFLRVRTDRLRTSVRGEASFIGPGIIQGVVGTNVWYGQLWETGHARNEDGKLIMIQHWRKRKWLSTALGDMFQSVWRQLTRAVKAALEK